MSSLETIELIEAISKLFIVPLIGTITYITQQAYIQKQKIDLEKIKSKYERDQIAFLKNKELQNNMTSEKISILMAWQNIYNNSIKCSNGNDTKIEERISLFLNPSKKKIKGMTIQYSLPLGELVSQTLIYSFSPTVHKYIERLMTNSYELLYKQKEFDELSEQEQEKNMENFKEYRIEQRCKSMAYTFTVYYFLSLEWQGLEEADTSLDIIGNIYLKDYHYEKEGEIKITKEVIEKIKTEEGINGK